MISGNLYAHHVPSSPICYFSLPVSLSHFSAETPSTSAVSAYTANTYPEPTNPLLAARPHPFDPRMSPSAAGSMLQLQTSAAHRPAAQPLQASPSVSPANSNSSINYNMASPSLLCCSRCRRESGLGMVQFGTNTYYCNHCARMTGYCAG